MTIFLTTAVAFITTNLDDLFLLTALFTLLERKQYYKIIIGQYLGLFTLLGLSIFAVSSLSSYFFIPVRLLGLIPLTLGVRSFMSFSVSEEKIKTNLVLPTTITGIALLTLSNGGDNISVYLSIFSSYSFSQLLSVVGLFGLFIGFWCVLGLYVSSLSYVETLIQRSQSWLIPSMLCCIGLSIIFLQ